MGRRRTGTCWAALVAIALPACVTWKPVPLDQLKNATAGRLRVVTKSGQQVKLKRYKVRGHFLDGRVVNYNAPARRVRVDLRLVRSVEREEHDHAASTAVVVVATMLAALAVGFLIVTWGGSSCKFAC